MAQAATKLAAVPESGLGRTGDLLRQFLPERTSEEILAGRIRIRLSGQDHILPVLTIRENRAWRELASTHLGQLTGGLASISDTASILARIASATDSQMALVRAYDKGGVLPDLEDVTEPELLRATFAVVAAAFPLAAAIIDQLLSNPELAALVVAEMRKTDSEPTSSPPQPGAGARKRSKTG